MIFDYEKEKQRLLETTTKLYSFLVEKFGYEYTLDLEFENNSGSAKYYIVRYTNKQYRRQIDLVLDRNSSLISFYIKRLINDEIPDYKDTKNCFNFYEVDFFNNPDTYDSERHNPYNPPDYEYGTLTTGVEVLKNNLDLVEGLTWIDREKLDKLSLDIEGYKMGWHETPIVCTIKELFGFLVDDHGFTIIDDYDELKPFEQGFGGVLVYQNKTLKLGYEFSFDLRDRLLDLYSFQDKPEDKKFLKALYFKDDLIKAKGIIQSNLL